MPREHLHVDDRAQRIEDALVRRAVPRVVMEHLVRDDSGEQPEVLIPVPAVEDDRRALRVDADEPLIRDSAEAYGRVRALRELVDGARRNRSRERRQRCAQAQLRLLRL